MASEALLMKVLLYSTLGCHLCEHARAILEPLAAASGYEVEEVEISDSEELLDRYKVTIPVARNPETDMELNWPFTPDQAKALFQ